MIPDLRADCAVHREGFRLRRYGVAFILVCVFTALLVCSADPVFARPVLPELLQDRMDAVALFLGKEGYEKGSTD